MGRAGTTQIFVKQNPDLASANLVYNSVAVVPTSATFYLGLPNPGVVKMGCSADDGRIVGAKPLDDQSAPIAEDLNRLLTDQFSARGFDVRIVESSRVNANGIAHLVTKIS